MSCVAILNYEHIKDTLIDMFCESGYNYDDAFIAVGNIWYSWKEEIKKQYPNIKIELIENNIDIKGTHALKVKNLILSFFRNFEVGLHNFYNSKSSASSELE